MIPWNLCLNAQEMFAVIHLLTFLCPPEPNKIKKLIAYFYG